jgi:AraC-like DNA-binding protein
MKERGIDMSSHLGGASIGESGVLLPLGALHAFLEECETRSGERWLGIELAKTRPVGSHGIVEFFWRSAATLREGFQIFAAHARLLNEVAEMRLTEAAEASFVQRVRAHPLGMGRHGNEFFVATAVREVRALVSPDFSPIRARLAHPRPSGDLAPLHRAMGTTEIVWSDPATGIDFDPRWLDAPLATADPSLATTLRAHTTAWLPWLAPDADAALDSKLSAFLHASIGTPVSLESAARQLGASVRTLQRRLAERETTFQAVADGVLMEHASRLIATGAIPVSQVAGKLGYGSMAAFVRAFRRWTGTTPTAWRKQRNQRRATRP